MAITFDPAKRDWTRRHRGLDFATDAATAFAGRTVTKLDDRFDYGESRYITAGYVGAHGRDCLDASQRRPSCDFDEVLSCQGRSPLGRALSANL
ncbi:hypothetical protein [Rhodopseudomonas sp. WA056]|uniref:hypothetical protein n=1 Tax=Rhodopseudomonas sp. WA056 TaxID=2269367 RepID=UPI0032E3A461